MFFVLSPAFIKKLSNLLINYQNKTQIKDLQNAPQPYKIQCFFGAKNVKTRNHQIHFLEMILTWVISELGLSEPLPEEIDYLHLLHQPQGEHYLTLLRFLLCSCLYIKSQIPEWSLGGSQIPEWNLWGSELRDLLDQAIGITKHNFLDSATKATCFYASQRYLQQGSHLELINSKAKEKLTEEQWYKFSQFVSIHCKKEPKKFLANYPITQFALKIVPPPAELIGYSIGYLVGDLISKTTTLMPIQVTLTNTLCRSTIFIVGNGVRFFAPTYASRILQTTVGLSIAWVGGSSMRLLGQGLACGLGLPLDISCQLIAKMLALLIQQHQSGANLTGLCLLDGKCYINGLEVQFIDPVLLKEEVQELSTQDFSYHIQDNGIMVTHNQQSHFYSFADLQKFKGLEDYQPLEENMPTHTMALT